MRRCLIVEDSEMVRRLVRAMVARLGFEVTEARNGQEALDMCRVRLPDLILVDWDMPVMDGMEFIARLRALPEGNGPKVLMCTVENNIEQIRHALSAGADEYIMKPFNKEVLANKLAFAVDWVGRSDPRYI
jgi:two-component system chemotaxis response regulator CheY